MLFSDYIISHFFLNVNSFFKIFEKKLLTKVYTIYYDNMNQSEALSHILLFGNKFILPLYESLTEGF
nr:MAG TPA: hypothetical protein [Caudoviricetes sp.]